MKVTSQMIERIVEELQDIRLSSSEISTHIRLENLIEKIEKGDFDDDEDEAEAEYNARLAKGDAIYTDSVL